MSTTNRLANVMPRDLYILEDESNPRSSKADKILPSTILDQVYDDQSPTNKNLRQILEDLKQEIITGGRGNIVFPVTSVNNLTGDIVLTKKEIGLGMVDNTADIDKPLSIPQREAVMDILDRYDFHVNMQEFYEHLMDTNNPHDVTLDQLNKNNNFDEFVKNYIAIHNYSTDTSIHTDIRRSLSILWNYVDDINNGLEDRIGTVLESLDEHIDDINAHFSLFEKKEDLSNKVLNFSATVNNDHTKYPSTRSVVEFVTNVLSTFKSGLTDVKDWIENINVIDDIKSLPTASKKYYRHLYFIRHGYDSHNNIALCRLNTDGTYSWDISDIGTFSKFNPNHFTDTTNGLSINMSSIVDTIISENGMLDTSLSEILKDYYTKEEIDKSHLINRINILPGTMHGTIRYYINDDMTTMSEDISIPGLKRLAYLEWITEDELWDNSVRSNHIITDAIETRHIQDKSIIPDKISCKWGYVIGNMINEDDTISHEVKLTELADILRPLIGGWPDPNTPGGNPYYDAISDQIPHPHVWTPGIEYDLADKSYAQRFTGTISVLPNMDIKTLLSETLNLDEYRIIEAGGSWMYQSDPEEWTILGGSNITGHTFATITMTHDGTFFESISIGDRVDASYDVWVKYIKRSELEN